jgi:membrane protein DedA with SNARE-associated domain
LDDNPAGSDPSPIGGQADSLPVDTVAPEKPKPSRRQLTFVVAPIIVVWVAGTIGNLFHPTLLVNMPLLLLALEPRFRYMLLIAPRVELLPFMAVALARRLVSDPFLYRLGNMYGETGVRWMEKRMNDTVGWIRKIEGWFGKAAWVFVLLWPGLVICTLAGATGMRFGVFLALNIVGTALTTYLCVVAADLLKPLVGGINNFYAGNQKTLLIISVVFTLLWVVTQKMQGKGDPISVKEIERGLEEASQDQPERSDADSTEGEVGA